MKNYIIDYNLVFNRVPPYIHKNHDADFRQTGVLDVLAGMGEISDEEYNYYENFEIK